MASSPDSAFRDAYWAAYRERPSDTVKRVRTSKERENPAPIFNDHVTCLECGRTMRRLRRHLVMADDLMPDVYRQRFRLRHDHPLVCARTVAPDRGSGSRLNRLGFGALLGFGFATAFAVFASIELILGVLAFALFRSELPARASADVART
jgi:hypothetical protein